MIEDNDIYKVWNQLIGEVETGPSIETFYKALPVLIKKLYCKAYESACNDCLQCVDWHSSAADKIRDLTK